MGNDEVIAFGAERLSSWTYVWLLGRSGVGSSWQSSVLVAGDGDHCPRLWTPCRQRLTQMALLVWWS